ncbi:hypothetical protein Leryth_005932 [Lithospermum erythrorhizon]|nr:hypothetical protein Leryth_005932 [Lithospermum erythrorhizon]
MNLWRDPGAPADSFYEVRAECTDVPKSKFRIKSGKTLSVRKWQAAFSPEGYLNIAKTLRRIHRGGIHPSIRGEVWEYLLGCYDPNSTFEEREQIRQRRRDQYSVLKEKCRIMFPVIGSGRFITAPIITESGDPIQDPLVLQEANAAKEAAYRNQKSGNLFVSIKETDKQIIEWKRTLHQIGLDVRRTDRTLVFYEKQENLAKLWDILSVYSWFDKDVGYCQGYETQCLYSAFCFPSCSISYSPSDPYSAVFPTRGNFRCTETSVGVESQLENLASITQVIDPKLHQHLEHLGMGNYLFAVRMLMVLFRREFSFCDSLYLWEMMWALEYDPELFLLYEDPETAVEKPEGSKAKPKSLRQCGKFERDYMRSGADTPLPISLFLVANVLKDRSAKLLTEARGLDDVVKILNDITGNLDAKKACVGALKLHKKYLRKSLQAKKP